MNKSLWQKLQPHAIAVGIFFIISCIYCLPALKGFVVQQHDAEGWQGMAQQSLEFKEKYGHYPLWSNSVFGGMPAFQIIIGSTYNITLAWLHHLFTMFLPEPASLFFLACFFFCLLLHFLEFFELPHKQSAFIFGITIRNETQRLLKNRPMGRLGKLDIQALMFIIIQLFCQM